MQITLVNLRIAGKLKYYIDMKLTKLQHACFYIEHDGKRLLVDPGNFTADLDAKLKLDYVVITHEHPDHLDYGNLKRIASINPEVKIITHPSTKFNNPEGLDHQTVLPGDDIAVGPFNLRFFGGEHAPIHPDVPHVANLAILINETVYYPGDSMTRPGIDVKYLALPISAPWLKISETIDLLRDINPTSAFPTHDAILSNEGKSLIDGLVGRLAGDINYQRINGSIEI